MSSVIEMMSTIPCNSEMSASCEWTSHKRTVSSLIGSRVVKRPKQDDGPRLQEAAIQLLEQHQDLSTLLREVETSALCSTSSSQKKEEQHAPCEGIAVAFTGSLLVWELRRQATQLGVPVVVLSVKTVLERLMEIEEDDEEKGRELLTPSQRVRLGVLLKSSKDLLSQGALSPKLLWQEYRREQRQPKLEVVYHLHYHSILSLQMILQSDDGVRSWLVSQLKALCSWKPPEEEKDTRAVQQKVFSMVAEVLVGTGFEQNQEPAASDKKTSLLCCSLLDDMLCWLLDTVNQSLTQTSAGVGAEQWIQIFDTSLCGVSVSADGLQRFFTHSLTQTLTYKPRLTVSDAITQQNEWTFGKASGLLTSLLRKLAVIFSEELLLRHLQQVLETSEVNWKHVLCFLSTLLVYSPQAQPSLTELLSRLLASAFEGYDLENMIMAFLLARQAALEGPSVFTSYSDWFKMCFGGSNSCHATSKKSLVFLLKFLSDLVPFEPSQYLKVHILHPPYVPMKHRSLLMEYVSLAKTRLADLKESVEDMGLYEDVSGADGASVPDVEKAVSLFESTGRISATVMEASIFRRPYFLTRFLPALLTPRLLPVKADARMTFIEALKKADKIPAAQYSSYLESCQGLRQQDRSTVCLDTTQPPVDVLRAQFQTFTALTVDGSDGEMSAQLSRIAHTLSTVFSVGPEEPVEQTVIRLHQEGPLSPELHVKVINMLLRCFCQCVLDTSLTNPPNKQSTWASRFVSVLLGKKQLLSSVLHRLWDLFHNQGSSLSASHLLGLAVFVVHLHSSTSHSPLIVLMPPAPLQAAAVGEVLHSALVCSTRTNMLLCVQLSVAAVCYGICKGESLPQQQQQETIPSTLYKKLLYLIPRLLPEARAPFSPGGSLNEHHDADGLWSSVTDPSGTWRTTAWSLWRHSAFQQLQHIPGYQLLFCDWLDNELRVQRSEDALCDSERQEYQQWACLELYLPRPEQQGGCGGDTKLLCSHLLKAVMNQQLCEPSSVTGTCLPDILSRIQELLYELEVTELSSCRRSRADVCDLLFDLVSQRCSSTVDSASLHSAELSLQHTLHTWNRLLLALPSALFVTVKADRGRTTLDCNKLIEHINQHQREACSPASSLSPRVTAHFLRGLLCASVRCRSPGEELNKAWCQISLHCPLLLISTVRWWQRLSPVLMSLWTRLCDGEPLPEQLQLISSCHHWASRLEKGLSAFPVPAAPALLLAASLHCHKGASEGFRVALTMLNPEGGVECRQLLVLLLSLCVNDYLSTLLYSKEKTTAEAWRLCTDLLTVLVDYADWLLIFKSDERGVCQLVTMVTPDAVARLMPWAFYSLLLQQSRDLLQRAMRCPGFLHTAVLCYIKLMQLFLDGHVPTSTTEPEQKVEPSQILSNSKEFVLRVIAQTPATALSSGQLRKLESQCADLDPEVAAALSVHLSPHSLSPEMDFI
ncbi:Fanconi anemia group A protein-like [Betta splendens]|uniref:Fanconi anemia group A protein-like n=1 Tax=Betta splendens TaxID=158456 RepID=A0A6P7MWX3_BETSP|nr:Fanconi anemia group A protein-like [Betta splendens]